ncbi:hypothetical protein NXS19_005474 [Fusarium pseudograminearum]|nr:hypothetical protein NXS19_005474 [Fusarium pseudograminearum]
MSGRPWRRGVRRVLMDVQLRSSHHTGCLANIWEHRLECSVCLETWYINDQRQLGYLACEKLGDETPPGTIDAGILFADLYRLRRLGVRKDCWYLQRLLGF